MKNWELLIMLKYFFFNSTHTFVFGFWETNNRTTGSIPVTLRFSRNLFWAQYWIKVWSCESAHLRLCDYIAVIIGDRQDPKYYAQLQKQSRPLLRTHFRRRNLPRCRPVWPHLSSVCKERESLQYFTWNANRRTESFIFWCRELLESRPHVVSRVLFWLCWRE